VLLGVVVTVFFLFQGFGDPSRLVMGQRADAATQENIRKELYLDQPRWETICILFERYLARGHSFAGGDRTKGAERIFCRWEDDHRI